MAKQVEALAIKPGTLSSMPGIQAYDRRKEQTPVGCL